MCVICSVNFNFQNLEEIIEYNEILEWVNFFQLVRVICWGGMILIFDVVFQVVIKCFLVESGCFVFIVNELIENVYECSWFQGLVILEIRQMN